MLAAADRAAAWATERVLADEVQRGAGLLSRPTVDVRGVPFLTQAVAGRYDRVDVVARGVPAGEVSGVPLVLPRASVSLRGSRVPLEDLLSGRVTTLPVERVEANALLPFDVVRRSADVGDLEVGAEGELLRLRGTVRVLRQDLTATALSRLTVDDGQVVVTAESFDVGGDGGEGPADRLADRLVTRALAGRFDVRVQLGALPYGLRVVGVAVQEDGLAVRVRADDTVLSPPPS